MVATSMLEHIFEGVNGDSIYRGASFFAGKLGQKIAGENVTVIDDGTLPGGFGTAPFDGEGIPTRRTIVIENGILKSYLLNTYTAKSSAWKPPPTHRAAWPARPVSAPVTFTWNPDRAPPATSGDVREGLYVTDFLASA